MSFVRQIDGDLHGSLVDNQCHRCVLPETNILQFLLRITKFSHVIEPVGVGAVVHNRSDISSAGLDGNVPKNISHQLSDCCLDFKKIQLMWQI